MTNLQRDSGLPGRLENLSPGLNKYCQELGKTDLFRQTFTNVAQGIAAQADRNKKEADRMMRCREWLLLSVAEEFRNYAPMNAIQSVVGSDRDGLLRFVGKEQDAAARSLLRLLGLNLLVNKLVSREVLVSFAGGVGAGKTTLACSLSGMDASHLRSDISGQSVVTLLVTPGRGEKLVCMPLSGWLQGRGCDFSDVWGASPEQATSRLRKLLALRSDSDKIPLAAVMDLFGRNVHEARGLACLKVVRPSDEGTWGQLRVGGEEGAGPEARITLLDARGFNTIADSNTVESGYLFLQGAEVPLLLVSLDLNWVKEADTAQRSSLPGNDYAEYVRGISSVLGGEKTSERMIVVFTFLKNLVVKNPRPGEKAESVNDVEDGEMVRRVCTMIRKTIRGTELFGETFRECGIEPRKVRWLLLDDVRQQRQAYRQMFWKELPEEVRDTYGSDERFGEWFVKDGGLTGVCALIRQTVQEKVLASRRQEGESILRVLGGGLMASLFNDTFPHLVPDWRALFRTRSFLQYNQQSFRDELDTQQLEGAAGRLLGRVNTRGAAWAHDLFYNCVFGDGGVEARLPVEERLSPPERKLVELFYPGVWVGLSAFLHGRSESRQELPAARVVEMSVACFGDALNSLVRGDGEGSKEHLRRRLGEDMLATREMFRVFWPLATELTGMVE